MSMIENILGPIFPGKIGSKYYNSWKISQILEYSNSYMIYISDNMGILRSLSICNRTILNVSPSFQEWCQKSSNLFSWINSSVKIPRNAEKFDKYFCYDSTER